MLVVFAPQALLYGLSVVLYGLLQSYRRFAALSIGPGISSLSSSPATSPSCR
jgi:putative peptidoglycan lipid II flippase